MEADHNIRLITTEDGSHSLFVPALNETYHSFHGAVQESLHVFIKMGLSYHLEQKIDVNELRVFEVGFGTGLNALLAAAFAWKHRILIHFTSIEAFPVAPTLVEKLNYTSFIENNEAGQWFKLLHTCEWNSTVQVHPWFTIKKVHSKLQDYPLPACAFDTIFFDAFAPNKQADMWDLPVLKKIAFSMDTGAAFVTYCAKGQLKRDLQSLDLKVDTLPGPPGKKEMVRAIKF